MHYRVHCARSFPSLVGVLAGRSSVNVRSRPGREPSHTHTASRRVTGCHWLADQSPAAEIGARHATLKWATWQSLPGPRLPVPELVGTRDLDHVIPLHPDDMPVNRSSYPNPGFV